MLLTAHIDPSPSQGHAATATTGHQEDSAGRVMTTPPRLTAVFDGLKNLVFIAIIAW